MSRFRHHRLGAFVLAAMPLVGVLFVGCAADTESPPAATETTSSGLDLPADAEQAAATIDQAYLQEVTAFLSSDALEGRAPGSEGDIAAQRYIAEQLEAAGATPAIDGGGFDQSFDIVGITADVPSTWNFVAGDRSIDFAVSDDFIAGVGTQEEKVEIDGAEVVFVGYGIEAPEFDWDDFGDADLEGKVLVMLNNDPEWDDALFAGDRRLYYGRWTYKYESAGRHGAAGAIIIHTDESAGYGWNVVQTSWTGTQFELPAVDGEPRVPVPAWLTYESAAKLFALAGRDLAADIESARSRDFTPIPLGVTTSLTVDATVAKDVSTANVVAQITGSDPELRDQYVVYTAHHDHLGRTEVEGDADGIYNGALDNASGVAQVLAIARAFSRLAEPPRRSILFLLVAAEEQGLLGSKHFAANPIAPAGQLAANVNFDAGNIWGRTKDLIYIGYGKSSLDSVVEAAAAMQGRHVVGDQFPDKGYFYRSDQFSLAKIGVPAVYLDGGTELIGKDPAEAKRLMDEWIKLHYHQPSDEIDDSWNYEGMIEDTQIGFYVGLHVADADALPRWNAGDEFEAARREALAAVDGEVP